MAQWIIGTTTYSNGRYSFNSHEAASNQPFLRVNYLGHKLIPTIAADKTNVVLQIAKGQNPTDQALLIYNAGESVLKYAVSNNVSWLNLSGEVVGTSSNESHQVMLSFSTATLAVGTYQGAVTITDTNASNSPLVVPVLLTVLGQTISVSVTNISVAALQGSNAAPTTIEIWNGGFATLAFSLMKTSTWLNVSPTSGTSTGDVQQITVQFASDSLTPGIYQDTLIVTNTTGETSSVLIPVTLTVFDKVAPPTFTPGGNTIYLTNVSVSISCATPGATIHYTLDGSPPTESSPVYVGPILLINTTILRAEAWKMGMLPSHEQIATFEISQPTLVAQPPTNYVWVMRQPFDPSTQDGVLAGGNGIHNLEGASQSAEVFNGKIYYAIRTDGSDMPAKIYCLDPASSNNVAVLNEMDDRFWALKVMKGALWVSHTNGKLWKSTNGVDFLEIVGTPFDANNYVSSMADFAGQMYFATSDGNIYESIDGYNFTLGTTITPGKPILTMASWNGFLYGANHEDYSYSAKIFRTSDGTNWSVLSTNIIYEFFGLVPTTNYLYLACMGNADGPSLTVHNTTNGTNWTQFFYTDTEGKAIDGHPSYFSQTDRVYYLSDWNGVAELFPVFNGNMESRIQATHGFSSVVEAGGRLFGIGSQNPSDWQSSPFVVSLLGNYTRALIPAFTTPIQIGAGTVRLNLMGENEHAYVIEVSTDLQNWTPVYTNVVTGEILQFDDTNAADVPVRFYRAVIQ